MKIRTMWTDHSVTQKTKLRLIKALVWSIVTYGCETWTLKKADEARIEAFEMWCIRRILRISYRDHRTNEWCLKQMGTKRCLLNAVKARKLRYYGHVQRQHDSLEKNILEGRLDGKRSRGRQRIWWADNIKAWAGQPTMRRCREIAAERDQWRAVVNVRGRTG